MINLQEKSGVTSILGRTNSPAEIASLLQQLIERSNPSLESAEVDINSNIAQQIMLDMCLDGQRYLLIRTTPEPDFLQPNLSPREKQIVRLIIKGFSNKTIAVMLDISMWTVATHMRRIFVKLGSSSRAEMVARVIQENLLTS